jgi:hypothetical protein
MSADWHGEVEHIQTGERWTFDTLEDMLGSLRRGAEDREIIRPAADGRN